MAIINKAAIRLLWGLGFGFGSPRGGWLACEMETAGILVLLALPPPAPAIHRNIPRIKTRSLVVDNSCGFPGEVFWSHSVRVW